MLLDDALANDLIKDEDYHRGKTRDIKGEVDFDVIINDRKNGYGVSEITRKYDDEQNTLIWDVLLHTPRLSNDPHIYSYRERLDALRNENRSNWDQTDSLINAVNISNDWWLTKPETKMPSAFCLSDRLVVLLLDTGFSADMMLLAYE
jgi:hypothetical protein